MSNHTESYRDRINNLAVVFVLNWNGTEDTCRLLRALKKSAVPYPVWVVDNGSEQDDSDLFKKAFAGVETLRITPNRGFAGGVNWAIDEAKKRGFRYAYEINNDCFVEVDPISPCVTLAETDSSIFAVGSCEPSKRHYYCKMIGPCGGAPCDSPGGFAILFRVDEFVSLGGLDERFFCYDEETDLLWRACNAGMRNMICPDSIVEHRHQGSDKNGNALYYRTRNRFLLKRKHLFGRPVYAIGTAASFVPLVIRSFPKERDIWFGWTQGLLHAFVFRYGKRPPPRKGSAVFFPLFVIVFGIAQVAFKIKNTFCTTLRQLYSISVTRETKKSHTEQNG